MPSRPEPPATLRSESEEFGATTPTVEVQARLAEASAQRGDWLAAVREWREVLKRRPGLAVAHTGLALGLRQLGELPAATAEFHRAAAANPAMPETHFNLGTHLLAGGQPGSAVAALRTALQLQPDYAEARFNLALALLKSGDFKTGALAYESRWKAEWKGKERPFVGPRWNGRALQAGPLLLWGEQGIGDEIMLAGLMAEAVRQAQAPVWLECAPRLAPLFARSFPGLRIFSRSTPVDTALAAPVVHAPLGSLPGLLWPVAEPPDPPSKYLQADPAAVERVRAGLAALGPGLKIGIAWRGGQPTAQPRRIPPEAWAGLIGRPRVVAVSLQHGPLPGEREAITQATGAPVHAFEEIDPLRDMDSFAALVTALDGVIAVDNSSVHLAGALGVPTAVLLGHEADWRWGIDGVPCPWYRSVMRLWQKTPLDWHAPMQAAGAFLAQLPGRP